MSALDVRINDIAGGRLAICGLGGFWLRRLLGRLDIEFVGDGDLARGESRL